MFGFKWESTEIYRLGRTFQTERRKRTMKQILAVICVVVLAFFATGCEKSEVLHAQEENQRAQRLQADANKVVVEIQYIKDPRTGLCFAYMSGLSGGMALATVPCEAIPPQLLTVAK